eukprot:m51a1_g27 hypothetical protein (468) ;mRNA; f:110567-113752
MINALAQYIIALVACPLASRGIALFLVRLFPSLNFASTFLAAILALEYGVLPVSTGLFALISIAILLLGAVAVFFTSRHRVEGEVYGSWHKWLGICTGSPHHTTHIVKVEYCMPDTAPTRRLIEQLGHPERLTWDVHDDAVVYHSADVLNWAVKCPTMYVSVRLCCPDAPRLGSGDLTERLEHLLAYCWNAHGGGVRVDLHVPGYYGILMSRITVAHTLTLFALNNALALYIVALVACPLAARGIAQFLTKLIPSLDFPTVFLAAVLALEYGVLPVSTGTFSLISIPILLLAAVIVSIATRHKSKEEVYGIWHKWLGICTGSLYHTTHIVKVEYCMPDTAPTRRLIEQLGHPERLTWDVHDDTVVYHSADVLEWAVKYPTMYVCVRLLQPDAPRHGVRDLAERLEYLLAHSWYGSGGGVRVDLHVPGYYGILVSRVTVARWIPAECYGPFVMFVSPSYRPMPVYNLR